MKIKSQLLINGTEQPKMVGRASFDTFLKLSDEFTQFAIDDLSLATVNNRYKVYKCVIENDKKTDFIKGCERYSTMDLTKFWIELALPDDEDFGLYFSPYWTKNGWLMDYGVTCLNDLYVVGRFKLDPSIIGTLPKAKTLKGFHNDFVNIDLRTHYLLDTIRKDMSTFDIAPCRKSEAVATGLEVTLATNGLGSWEHKMGALRWKSDEAEKYLKLFQEWAATKKWSKAVKVAIRPSVNRWVTFAVIPKFKSVDIN